MRTTGVTTIALLVLRTGELTNWTLHEETALDKWGIQVNIFIISP